MHCVVCGRISLSPSHVWRRGLNCFISLCATHSCSLCSPCSPPSPLLQQTRPSVGRPPPSGSLVISPLSNLWSSSFLHFPSLSFNCQPLDLNSGGFPNQILLWNQILLEVSPDFQTHLSINSYKILFITVIIIMIIMMIIIKVTIIKKIIFTKMMMMTVMFN